MCNTREGEEAINGVKHAVPCARDEGHTEGVRVWLHSFLNSELHGGDRSHPLPGRRNPGMH